MCSKKSSLAKAIRPRSDSMINKKEGLLCHYRLLHVWPIYTYIYICTWVYVAAHVNDNRLCLGICVSAVCVKLCVLSCPSSIDGLWLLFTLTCVIRGIVHIARCQLSTKVRDLIIFKSVCV